MKTSKSAGTDKISVKLLEVASKTILNTLKNVFKLSLNTGIFPDDWKIAGVTAILKSDNKTDCGNYRPISVISNVAQIFEKAVYNQLITFSNENKVIVENQSRFRTNHSTETTLRLLQSIINYLASMDKGLINKQLLNEVEQDMRNY